MDSGMVNKILKAKEYAAEPHRIQFSAFKVHFDGLNDGHTVEFNKGNWNCDCHYFGNHGVCSHSMAMERVLGVMLPAMSTQESS